MYVDVEVGVDMYVNVDVEVGVDMDMGVNDGVEMDVNMNADNTKKKQIEKKKTEASFRRIFFFQYTIGV